MISSSQSNPSLTLEVAVDSWRSKYASNTLTLKGTNSDLHQLAPVYGEYIAKEDSSVKEQVSFLSLDFFKEEFPAGFDMILFGNVLHDWDDSVKVMLIKKTFDALPKGGHIMIYDFFLTEGKG